MTNLHIPKSDERVKKLIDASEAACAEEFARVERIEQLNTRRIIEALQENRISARHFAATTGYGYDDIGRDALSSVFARALGTESALVRPQIASGTHALALCLFGILRPGDNMISGAGKPYDTLEEVIGLSGEAGRGSLADYGVGYRQSELLEGGEIDIAGVVGQIDADTKLVLLQRSRGYDWRPSLSVGQLNRAIDAIHLHAPAVCVMVDNCYGEFTDTVEPRADLMAGSLIKNPGGGIAPTGGYIAGARRFVDLVAYRLTTPGIGAEVGSYAGGYQPFFQGIFLAPHVVAQAVKTSILAAHAFEQIGFNVHPKFSDPRNDIIQAIRFDDADKLIKFIQAIQMCSPIDAEAVPMPWDMPGYQTQVIMAAGTFVAGASVELSADAPIRPPYIAYLQGALTYAHGRMGIEGAIAHLLHEGLISLQ